ncbi:Peptidase S24/S26A/S26B/S26C family protein [Hibiscus syriacus]|uniref:Peptidase S24/S26A/S26B/S26C family protein n=1 Tax=Hibiscus syriacus TaxID=106335 RepID=A0A6A3AW98_HIBSY|nr:Peptidase S24/S26A/S26B/S26C family protein [Hibiscus syriacus]
MRIIMLYGKAGKVKHAINTFHDMHLYGCKRTVKSFNAALKVLIQTRDLGAIEAILADGLFFMVEMEKLGIKPDVITYTTLITTSYQKNRCKIGSGLWNLMKIGIEPDEVTYNLVIKGFCQAGYLEMAKRVYSSLEGRSKHRPNVKIYQTIIHYLCKGGEYNLAYARCIDCMRKSSFPNVDTIHSLLQGLMRNGQLCKANMIMKLVRSRKPPFSSTQLDSLQSILSRK